MRLLLDTAVFLWWVTASEFVPAAGRIQRAKRSGVSAGID